MKAKSLKVLTILKWAVMVIMSAKTLMVIYSMYMRAQYGEEYLLNFGWLKIKNPSYSSKKPDTRRA